MSILQNKLLNPIQWPTFVTTGVAGVLLVSVLLMFIEFSNNPATTSTLAIFTLLSVLAGCSIALLIARIARQTRVHVKRAEQANSEYFQFLTEHLGDVVWSMDLEMNFTYFSPSVQASRGYTPEEAMRLGASNFSDSVGIEDAKKLLKQRLLLDNGSDPDSPLKLETRVRHKDGGQIYVEIFSRFLRDETGKPTGVIGVSRDISERKSLEKAMESVIHGTERKVGTDFFHSLARNLAKTLEIKSVLIGELMADSKIKTICMWMDNEFVNNFEYSLLGTPCEEVLQGEVCSYPNHVQEAFPDDTGLVDMGMQSYLGVRLSDSDNNTIGILHCMDNKPMDNVDMATDLLTIFSAHASAELSRRQAQRATESVETQLLQAQKMESIGQMAGGVAHDFNNLLMVIKGYTELAEQNTPKNSNLSNYHQQIDGAADRAASLTRKLLSFSRRQIMDTEPLSLNSLLEETGHLLKRLLPESIDYELIAGNDLGTIEGDSSQLQQAVVNLAINARDAMPGGGKLTIETENIYIDQSYVDSHPWASMGRYVLLRVSDTGIGIPADIQDRIFEPFFTTKPEGSGTGLGLSVLFGVIKQHAGFTQLYSEMGKGTEFRIYLPIVERTATSLERKLSPNLVRGHETILLVEDDDQVRILANTFLTLSGYTVILAENGEIAVSKFTEHQDQISLAVIDVVLPKMGGREVMEEIRALSPDLPVLFCSGYSANGIHTNFILEDELMLLQKPYSRDELLRKVREILD